VEVGQEERLRVVEEVEEVNDVKGVKERRKSLSMGRD
jgi:hypothetical protein